MTDPAIELALPLIQQFEGFQATPYTCPAGKRTVGFGHVILPTDTLTYPLSEEAAETLLRDDLARFATGLAKALPHSPLTRSMQAALLSFTFNVGMGAFFTSTLLTMLKGKLYEGAAEQFARWNKATVNGQKIILPGLVKRRQAERELYLRDGMPKGNS